MSAQLGLQLDMTVIQRIEHPTQDIEQLLIAGLRRYLRSVSVVLLIPVNIPQFEEWVSVVECLPQHLEILLGVPNHLVSMRKVGHQSYEKLRAGERDCVEFHGVPADKTHNPCGAL